jgi:hypothetical protein
MVWMSQRGSRHYANGIHGIDYDHDTVSPAKDTLFSSFPINLSPELGVSPTLPRTCDCGITTARIHHQPGRFIMEIAMAMGGLVAAFTGLAALILFTPYDK